MRSASRATNRGGRVVASVAAAFCLLGGAGAAEATSTNLADLVAGASLQSLDGRLEFSGFSAEVFGDLNGDLSLYIVDAVEQGFRL